VAVVNAMTTLGQVDPDAALPLEPVKEFWDYWPWWSGSALIAMVVIGLTIALLYHQGLRRRRLSGMLDQAGFEPLDLSDARLVGEELDDMLGGSALYRSGYVTSIDGWWRKREGEMIIDVVDYREWPVPGGPRRSDEETAYYNRREMTDRSETLVVIRHEQFAALPRFLLMPNNVFLAAMAPKHDLLTFGNLKFNKRNRITTPEPGETHALFDRDMQKMLINNRSMSIESFADALVFAYYGSALWPDKVRELLDRGRAFGDAALVGEPGQSEAEAGRAAAPGAEHGAS